LSPVRLTLYPLMSPLDHDRSAPPQNERCITAKGLSGSASFAPGRLPVIFAHEKDVHRRDPSAVIRGGDLYYVWYTN
jgi:hypothetical protein